MDASKNRDSKSAVVKSPIVLSSPKLKVKHRLWLMRVSLLSVLSFISSQQVLAQADIAVEPSSLAAPVSDAMPEQPTPKAMPAAPVTPAAEAPPASPAIAPAVSTPPPEFLPPASVSPPVAPAASPPASNSPVQESIREEAVPAKDRLPDAIPTAENTPTDFGSVFIDPTNYSVGATSNPQVIFSDRSTGCQFTIAPDQPAPTSACAQAATQPAKPEAAAGTIAGGTASQVPAQTPAFRLGPIQVSVANVPSVQVAGGTTAASRDYYTRLTRPLVNLQIGKDFIFPLSIPAPITSLFGWRLHPIFGEQRFHAGTDIGAPLGTPVLATRAGQVIASELLGGYGLTVILQHGEGELETRYAHLSHLLVKPGEQVNQGDVIGLVGSTGNSTGPHLHFELRQLTGDGWVLVNPNDLLQYALAQLIQTLNNPIQALALAPTEPTAATAAEPEAGMQTLPFRPAQPNAN